MKSNRVFALLLALIMLFSLAACGESKVSEESALMEGLENAVNAAKDAEPTPEPTPEPTVLGLWETEIDMSEAMIAKMDESVGGSKSFGEYLHYFAWLLTLELNEDGSYALSFDISKDLDHFKPAVTDYTRDMIIEKLGYEVSDDVIADAIGMSLEDYAQTIVDSMISASQIQSGTYRDEDSKLIWDTGEENPYVLTGDTLLINLSGLGELSFQRIG